MLDVHFGGALWLLHGADVKISLAGKLSFYFFFKKNSSCAQQAHAHEDFVFQVLCFRPFFSRTLTYILCVGRASDTEGERREVTGDGSSRCYNRSKPRLGPVLGDRITRIRFEFNLHQEILCAWS